MRLDRPVSSVPIAEQVISHILDPRLRSSRQEMLEDLVSRYL
jgi:xylose isomerase